MPLESKWAKEAEKLPPPTLSKSSKQVERLMHEIDEPLPEPKSAPRNTKSQPHSHAAAPETKAALHSEPQPEPGPKLAGLGSSKWAKLTPSSPAEKSPKPARRKGSRPANTESHGAHSKEPTKDLADQIRALQTGPRPPASHSKPPHRRPNRGSKPDAAAASSSGSEPSKPASFAAWEDLFDPDESSWAEAEEEYVFNSAR